MRNTKETRELIINKIRETLKDFIGQARKPIEKGMVVETIGFTQFVPDNVPKASIQDIARGVVKLNFVFCTKGSLFLVIDEPLKNHQVNVMCLTNGHTGWIDAQALKAYE